MVYYTGKLIEKGIQTMRFGKAKKQNNLRIQPLSPSLLKIVWFFLHCIAEFHYFKLSDTKLESSLIHIWRGCEIAKTTTV